MDHRDEELEGIEYESYSGHIPEKHAHDQKSDHDLRASLRSKSMNEICKYDFAMSNGQCDRGLL